MMPVSTIIVLTCDIMAAIVIVILLYAMMFENTEKDKKTKYFIICCWCTLLSLATDIPSWYFENKSGYDFLLYITNTLALDFSLVAVAFVSFYELEIIGRGKYISEGHAHIVMTVCILTGVLITIGVFTGQTFVIDDGAFTYGPWYSIAPGACLILLVYMEVLAVIKRKYLGLHDTLAFGVYMVLPLISALIEVINPELSLALAATALSALILYVMLQSGHVSALHMRGEQLHEYSMKDFLTGLLNRRAFDDALDSLDDDLPLNIIFCDLNGLKYTNDSIGHAAGDERLQQLSGVLKKHFSYDGLFRISGDEFVVIIPRLSEESFQNRLQILESDLRFRADLASYGAASGIGADKMQLLKIAEERMYDYKIGCYERHPEYKR